MGVSIYYDASRPTPLTPEEQKAIDAIVEKYSVTKEIEQFLETGVGWRGESFDIDPPQFRKPGVIFQGSTGLPLETIEESVTAAKRWCQVLTEIRRAVPDAEWSVNIDDAEIPWDEEQQAYVLEEYNLEELEEYDVEEEEPVQPKPAPKRIPQKKPWYLPILKFLRMLFPSK